MLKNFPTQFISTNGVIRVWKAVIMFKYLDDNNNKVAVIKIKYGVYKGKITEKHTFVDSGKNTGKSNETTVFEQAEKDVISSMNSNHTKGYRTLAELGITKISVSDKSTKNQKDFKNGIGYLNDNTGKIYPHNRITELLHLRFNETKDKIGAMKLHHLRLPSYVIGSNEYKKSKDIKFPVYVQPKKDGVYCAVYVEDGLITRSGKKSLVNNGMLWNDICPQIKNAVETLDSDTPLTGEIYKYGYNLNDITTACKVPNKLSPFLQLHLFDIIDITLNQIERFHKLSEIEGRIKAFELDSIIKVIPKTIVYNWEELFEVEEKWLNLGEEGVVIRTMSGMYVPKRSKDVLKLVRFDSSEVLILDIVPMKKEPKQGMFLCKVSNAIDSIHTTFLVTPSEFTHEQRIDLLSNKDKYIGKLLTINHRGFTPYNVPRIATAVVVRLDNNV